MSGVDIAPVVVKVTTLDGGTTEHRYDLPDGTPDAYKTIQSLVREARQAVSVGGPETSVSFDYPTAMYRREAVIRVVFESDNMEVFRRVGMQQASERNQGGIGKGSE